MLTYSDIGWLMLGVSALVTAIIVFSVVGDQMRFVIAIGAAIVGFCVIVWSTFGYGDTVR